MTEEHTKTEDNSNEVQEHVTEERQESIPASELSTLIEQLNEAQKLADANKNDYLRAMADLENYRKRAQRDKDETRAMATSYILESILPIVDNLALGLVAAEQHQEDKIGSVIKGFEMVLAQMQTLLKDNNVEALEPKTGDSFDPNHHECMSHVPHESVEEEKIIELVRPGYTFKGRLLRPASVVVSSGKSE